MPRKKRPCIDCGALKEPGTGSSPRPLICRDCRRARGIWTNSHCTASHAVMGVIAKYQERRSRAYA